LWVAFFSFSSDLCITPVAFFAWTFAAFSLLTSDSKAFLAFIFFLGFVVFSIFFIAAPAALANFLTLCLAALWIALALCALAFFSQAALCLISAAWKCVACAAFSLFSFGQLYFFVAFQDVSLARRLAIFNLWSSSCFLLLRDAIT